MNGSSWRRVLLAGYGLLAACMTPVSVAAQGSGPNGTPSIYLRTPQPTPRLIVKQKLDEILASVVAAPQAGDSSSALHRLADAYSAFGFPAEAWDLFSRYPSPLERGQALEILADDGNLSFVSDALAGIPDFDPKKCAIAEDVALRLDRTSRNVAVQFRARHSCLRATPPVITPPAPALDELRTHVGMTCHGEISVKNDCWMRLVSMTSLFLRQTAGSPEFATALREVSSMPHAELRARVLWTAMIGLAQADKIDELRGVFAMIQAIASEGGALAAISELASGQVQFGESVCLLKGTFAPEARPVLAGRPISPGFDGCGRATPKTMILSTVLALHKAGRAELAQKIFAWYQTTAASTGDPRQQSSKIVGTAGSNRALLTIDTIGFAIMHAYTGNTDIGHDLLRRYDPETEVLKADNAFWLAYLGLDEVLPAAFRRAQLEGPSSWFFACAWLRGLALKGDVNGVAQIAKLLEPQEATRCLADAISLAVLNGRYLGKDMAGLALAKDSPFRRSTSRAWAKYAASLIAAKFDDLAQRAMVTGLEEGLVSYSSDLDEREHSEAWDGTLTTLTTEMFIRGHRALIRSSLSLAPSEATKSLVVLRLAAALADQGQWTNVPIVNEWADLSRVPPSSKYNDPWTMIARSYARAGDMEMVFKLIQLGLVDLWYLWGAMAEWRSGGRIVGP